MPAFLRKIIGDKEFEGQLATFASIAWQLSPVGEELYVNKEGLAPEQSAVLDALVAKKLLDGPKYSDNYRIRAPHQANTEQNALWDAAFPAAEGRLNVALAPLINLPWKYTQTSSNDYFLWKSELQPSQLTLIENAPEGAIRQKENGDLFVGFRKGDVLYQLTSEGQGHTRNRLHTVAHESVEGGITRDKSVLAHLPWEFDERGNLVLDAGVVAHLPNKFALTVTGQQKLLPEGKTGVTSTAIQAHSGKSEVEEILKRRGVKSDGGKYVLGLPNTVGKLYDAPDGDTDRARIEFYEHAHNAALERHKPVMALPWRFDKKRWAFVVTDADLTASQHKEKVEGALVKQGGVYEVHSLKDFSWRASGPRAQVEQFRKQLETAVPDDIKIGDLAELPWKYDYNGLSVPKAAFMNSKFARDAQSKQSGNTALIKLADSSKVIPFEINYDGRVVIRPDNVDELPYYAVVKRRLEKRFEQFVSGHTDEIRALPWSFGLRDDIKSYGTAKLYAEDLNPEQRKLVDQLIGMNQMGDHIGKEFSVVSDHMFNLLQPQFEQWKPLAVSTVAELPWEHHPSGIQLAVPVTKLTGEHAKGLERLGIRNSGHGSHSIRSDHESAGYNSTGDKVLNDLRYAIAKKIRERTPVAKVTEEVMSLPWQYGGMLHGKSIVLDGSKITDGQEAALKKAIPEIYHMEHMELFDRDIFSKGRKGYFELAAPGDHYIARSVIDEPYYAALKPVAEKHLDHLIKDVAAFPWRKSDQGGYEVSERELTEEQQLKMKQTPSDYFDYETARARHNKHSSERIYILDPNAEDKRLVKAVKSRQTALPEFSG